MTTLPSGEERTNTTMLDEILKLRHSGPTWMRGKQLDLEKRLKKLIVEDIASDKKLARRIVDALFERVAPRFLLRGILGERYFDYFCPLCGELHINVDCEQTSAYQERKARRAARARMIAEEPSPCIFTGEDEACLSKDLW